MIADTTFLSQWHDEFERGAIGPARAFERAHRRQPLFVTVISVGELAVIFPSESEARAFLRPYRILRLTPEIAYSAAAVDRELIAVGRRMGENDTWIAGFCRYWRQPVISRDAGFDRVRGLRRAAY